MKTERQRQIEACIQRHPFARRLGAEVAIVRPGHSRVTLTVTEDKEWFVPRA